MKKEDERGSKVGEKRGGGPFVNTRARVHMYVRIPDRLAEFFVLFFVALSARKCT